MPTASSIPLTDLDKQRFNAWFEYDSRLPDLASELETNVLELAEWARQPHIAERLDAVATIARQRHATLRAEAQHAATARLLRIVRFCDHDEIARRAADRLLRSVPTGERPLYDEPDPPRDIPVRNPEPTRRSLESVPVLHTPATPRPSVTAPSALHAAPTLSSAASPSVHPESTTSASAVPTIAPPADSTRSTHRSTLAPDMRPFRSLAPGLDSCRDSAANPPARAPQFDACTEPPGNIAHAHQAAQHEPTHVSASPITAAMHAQTPAAEPRAPP